MTEVKGIYGNYYIQFNISTFDIGTTTKSITFCISKRFLKFFFPSMLILVRGQINQATERCPLSISFVLSLSISLYKASCLIANTKLLKALTKGGL